MLSVISTNHRYQIDDKTDDITDDKKDNTSTFELLLKQMQWDNVLQHPTSDIYFHNFAKTFFELYDTALAKVSIKIESKT